MIKEIQLPEIAENVTDGVVTSVLVSEGDSISAEQNIIEMETDKASVEVPAPFGGTVTEILVSDGDEISVGQTVMKVETEEESESDDESEAKQEKSEQKKTEKRAKKSEREEPAEQREEAGGKPAAKEDEAEKPAGEKAEESGGGDSAPQPKEEVSGASDVPASPATRRLAREIGVDVTEVSGSGPSARISSEDVKAHAREAASGRRGSGGESKAGTEGAGATTSGERRESMTRIRALTAERTAESWASIPHVTQHEEADLTELNAYMKRMAPKVEKAGGKLTVTAVLVKLVAQALRVYPRFNASADIEAGEIVYHDRVAIGIAADTDRGLLVPVVRDPDRKGITSIAIEIGELAAQARDGSIEPSQMQGATFAVSNLGGIGGMGFTPIIVPPAVAILGVARAKTQPVYNGRSFEPHEVLPLSLSYDHRVIDGADGARFVVWLKTAIEDPFAALMEGGR